ncbi:reverse transcriptase/maturase family protein [Extibacter muris]|jgi:group II intron reverse transcriptase/maturase|uniref:Group II intron reverse transcriptase/maturase n=1 Tax=Extibacter muris TaxID=1796622 RepID=A0A4R4F8G3_9FIRM|nr:reverse transcriptase/maturase family protein [Extibacter muris]MCU0081533.1 reverse transcriptase domain-containing protein [Extibacter muris]TDA20084.1 group II intron reverse transcriptase/maturase [Extibacter muris]
MRSPENVLKSLSEKATDKTYRFERLYRNLYNPEFYLLAYQKIAISQGSMTAGADGLTLDGMSMERIEKLIAKLRDHSYQPNPARRVYIAKRNSSKKRPLGIPSTDDKLLQEVVRMILEAIYEPAFSENSHGFRPNRSCHTALKEISTLFTGAKWIIEGDIEACFDSFDHHITIQLLRKRIKDEAFISLMWKFLRAGYMEQWTYHETYSGSPQGSGVSPILANIYLSELDEFMAMMKAYFDRGETRNRKVHKDHDKVRWAFRKAKKNLELAHTEENLKAFKEAQKVLLSTPHLDEMDDGYKRLQYNRYADDFLIAVTGSKEDAQEIKDKVRVFLKDSLNLTMSEEKTHITHSSEKVRYLGYDIKVSRSQDTKRIKKKGLQRVWYGKVQLYMPKEKWIAKLHEYGVFKIKKDGDGKEIWKPLHRGYLMPLDEVAIISKYNSEIRGLYNYYRLAINVSNLGKFHGVMRGSCLKTLAAKYNSSVMKMYKKYRSEKGDFGANYKTKSGIKRCEFYHEGFKRNKNIAPEFVDVMPQFRGRIKPNSLAGRLKSGKCEACGASPVKVYMHHVKRLKDLKADNEFDLLMMKKRRKSLALCPKCYEEAKLKSLRL